MFPLLLNSHIDGVMERRAPLQRSGENREWERNKLLFADNTSFVANSEQKLNSFLREFGSVYKRR